MEYDDRKLFVAKMPEDIREEEVKIVFNTYGTVQEVVMLGPERSRPGQRCGFVIYETSEAARSAVQVLDNVYKFREGAPEPIHVSVARPRGGGPGKGKDQGGGGGGGYGKGYDYNQGGYGCGGGGCGGGGYGGNSYNGGCGGYDQGFKGGYNGGYNSYQGESYGNGGKGGCGGGGGGKGEPGTKLYVGNLPGDIQKDAIEHVFKTYGTVNDVHIMTGKSKSGQACAFVRYAQQVEANNAIAAMAQGYEIRPGEGHIIVKLADGPDGKGSKGRPSPY